MVPSHIAFIMDGNGRWAKANGKPRSFGHKSGSETLKQICIDAYDLGVKYVTVYAFSTENWKRSEDEVTFLMGLLRAYLKESIKNAKENNMRVRVIGRRTDLDEDIIQAIENMERASESHTGLTLTIALNYGGRDEIIRGIKSYIKEKMGKLASEVDQFCDINQSCNSMNDFLHNAIEDVEALSDLDENSFSQYLDTKGIPDPDLLIRTSGELRTSNFLPWQLAYTEFYFTHLHWPDFSRMELEKAIDFYQNRERRFGGRMNED